MRTDSSSKNPKKKSHEDRAKKKKIKSSKRHRDPSLSSYSTDSDEDSRRRRKISKSKRRKESKKSEQRRGRKKRYRRYSSVSSSDSDSIVSCSTCSSSDRSRCPVRRCDQRAKLSPRGRSKGKKRDRERGKEKSSRRYESSNSSRYRSRSCSTCSRGSNWSDDEEKFREKDRPRSLKSALKVSKSSEEREERYGRGNEGRDKIIKAYDDFPSSRSNNENLDNGIIVKADKNSDVIGGDSLVSDIGLSTGLSMREKNEVNTGDGCKEADDLELMLRQKALENFRKFRGQISEKKESLGNQKDEVVESDSFRSLKDTSRSEHQMQVQGGDQLNEFRARSASNHFSQESVLFKPTEKDNVNSLRSSAHNSSEPKPLGSLIVSGSTEVQSILNETSELMSLDQTSVTKGTQQQEHGIIKANGAQEDIADGSAPQASHLNKENENSKSILSAVESVTESQFEQKTFSRVHDGETVQVSYKVYIPKKAPALTRRQLQR